MRMAHMYVSATQGVLRTTQTDDFGQIQLASITEKGIFANGNAAEGALAVGLGDDTPANA
jgi:hypothetical protein